MNTIFSKIVTFGSPSDILHECIEPYPFIARSQSGRTKQIEAAKEMVRTGSCMDARVICHTDRKVLKEADISDYIDIGCWQEN